MRRSTYTFRLILYFPVSALVTLFANILQNPHDARARTDVKLMNQVVTFLSSLCITEEQGGVKRMLGVCSEFERIAKVVLEKGDKDSSRRKRKNKDGEDSHPPLTPQVTPRTPMSNKNPATPAAVFTPGYGSDLGGQTFNPSLNDFSTPLSNNDICLPMDFNPSSGDFSNIMSSNGISPNFNAHDLQQQYSTDGSPSLSMGSFQQPFVPQDLWQMPMTLEWDWADMTSVGYQGLDVVDGTQHLPHSG